MIPRSLTLYADRRCARRGAGAVAPKRISPIRSFAFDNGTGRGQLSATEQARLLAELAITGWASRARKDIATNARSTRRTAIEHVSPSMSVPK